MKISRVIITGVNGDLGSALVKAYQNNNYEVIGLDKHKTTKHQIKYLDFDFSKLMDTNYRNLKTKSLLSLVKNMSINVVINNAAYQKIKEFEKINLNDVEESLNVNFKAPFFLIKTLLNQLIKSKSKVINIGTIHNRLTLPNFFCYASSKMAMSSITKSLSVELGDKVEFVEVSPGAIDTKMLKEGLKNKKDFTNKKLSIPNHSFINPDSLADLIFQISHQDININGAYFNIDGGSSNLLK